MKQWNLMQQMQQPDFSKCCVWKKCPDDVDVGMRYFVNKMSPRIATRIKDYYNYYCTIIRNTPLSHNKVISWSIKILKSKYNDGDKVYVGLHLLA